MIFGQIVLVPFPFAEQTHKKVRPAVIITETSDKYRDLVVSAISSVVPVKLQRREIIIASSPENLLRVDSVIKVDRIITIKREDIIATLGQLSDSEKQAFKTSLIEMINDGAE